MTSFVFEMGKYQELFQIDSRGWITILAHGENITQNSYTFSVKIFDDGIPPRQAITEVTLQFPPLPTMPAPAEVKGMAEGDYVLIYILGALVGILLIVLIVLLVYIKKRATACFKSFRVGLIFKRIKSLNPEKQSNHINTSKAVRNYAPSLSPAESVNSDLHIDLDAMTTTMENPLALENPAFSFQYGTESTDEVDTTIRGVGEIEIGTAVAPYNENADSDNDSDSEMKPKTPNGDISSRNSIVSQNSIGNGSIHSSGPESLPNGIHKGSTQMLVQQEKANKAKKVKKLSWGKTRHMDSQTEIPLDPDVSVTPYDSSTDSLPKNAMQETADGKKPSITIYF
ncbi:uncharacterized protein LOC106171225 isoform X1 [Lingula anatina]|uniref:Uncharacterized protein LOC106171225 isoform X1 n=1 Tax=Lingula anatina TaxID=7574 RepID=A0A1S3J9C4_LINAN|nr:uncharacterized protein LOC106171225 isoform X1 [Lingula anatina]|eukprot:XP_013406913.1 uncharacterized protein LOC106171225 isoform X1 [Lingula anatina]